MTADGSRFVTRSGLSSTAGSSVACLDSQGRGTTTPESTSKQTGSFEGQADFLFFCCRGVKRSNVPFTV